MFPWLLKRHLYGRLDSPPCFPVPPNSRLPALKHLNRQLCVLQTRPEFILTMFRKGTVLTDSGAGGVAPGVISVPAVGTRMQEACWGWGNHQGEEGGRKRPRTNIAMGLMPPHRGNLSINQKTMPPVVSSKVRGRFSHSHWQS